MTIYGCAATPEEDGANFIPPTMGEFMKKQAEDATRLREARAGAAVVKEARLFHEKKAQKYGLHTRRGSAHLRAARMFSREAGASLQERLESFNSQVGEIDPKVLAHATKDTIQFHQKMAKKHGLDSDLGHAHTAAMEHHMDTLQKLKQGAGAQQKQEGGPGSGPKKGDLPLDKDKMEILRKKELAAKDKEFRKDRTRWNKFGKDAENSQKEALPGKSGKMSPVPVPKKSEIPNSDVKMNKPPINIDAQQGGGKRLQQGEEGGPGSGPRPHGGSQKKQGSNSREQHRAAIREHEAASNKHMKMSEKAGLSRTEEMAHINASYAHGDAAEAHRDAISDPGKASSRAAQFASSRANKASSKLSGSKESKHSFESRMRSFSREAGGRGPNDEMDCTLPDTNPLKQIKKDKVYRGPQNVKREARRRLRRRT